MIAMQMSPLHVVPFFFSFCYRNQPFIHACAARLIVSLTTSAPPGKYGKSSATISFQGLLKGLGSGTASGVKKCVQDRVGPAGNADSRLSATPAILECPASFVKGWGT